MEKKKLVIQVGGICDGKAVIQQHPPAPGQGLKTETTSFETGTSVLLSFSVQLLLYCFVLPKHLQMFILHMFLSQAHWTADVHVM